MKQEFETLKDFFKYKLKESKLNLNAGDYAIRHCIIDQTYNGLEVHKMLCDAYIAGNNDTLEDDDERIKNSLINLIKMSSEVGGLALHKWEADEMLAWLEKHSSSQTKENNPLKQSEQEASYTTIVETGDGGINALVTRELPTDGEQKPADTVEPKFKAGEWIVFNGLPLYIKEVVKGYYRTISEGGIPNSLDWDVDKLARLWTIQEAKDGDVLAYVTDEEDLWIMIYWSLYEPYEGHVHYHALLVNDKFSDKGTCCICINDLKPATKEQRDLLLQKMKEAGYVWDAEKKELRKRIGE